MTRRAHALLGAVCLLFGLASPGRAQERGTGVAHFETEVRPLLVRSCVACHGPATASAGIRLDRPIDRATAQRVLAAVRGDGKIVMPPAGRLPPAQVAAVARWVDDGAPFPTGAAGAGRDGRWAFQPIRTPAVPKVPGARTPIDAFVRARLAQAGLRPAPSADRRTLIRRVTYDLTGLPPTPTEIGAFLADRKPAAFERVVDRLLASPAYGERWGRLWLDVAHYADTHGYDKDKRRDNAWRYRDWVIGALNDDMPWSRFVRMQVAGDVLFPGTPDGVVATGFLAAGPWDFVGQLELAEGTVEKEKTRNLDRDDIVASVIGSFNSVTIHCARCHDHKFDPIPQRDYYRLQAVFAGIERGDRIYAEGTARTVSGSPTNGYHSAIAPTSDTAKWVQLDLGKPQRLESLRLIPARPTDFPDTPGFGFPVRYRVEASDEPAFAAPRVLLDRTGADTPSPMDSVVEIAAGGAPARYVRVTATRLWKRTDDFVFALGEVQAIAAGRNVARGAAVTALDSIEAGRWSARALVDGYDSRGAMGQSTYAAVPRAPRPIHLLARGEVGQAKDLLGPGALSCLTGVSADLPIAEVGDEGQRRAALAVWLTRPDHPLTWRSVVNRVWAGHFGKGIVDTPNDFGALGGRPTHPELLDWLASTFQRSGQSLKNLHRSIVLSDTYRQSATPTKAALAKDSENRLLSHMSRRRLDAEQIRDAVLAAAGTLDHTAGGPGYDLFRFKDDHSPVYDHDAPGPVNDPKTWRRTVYRFVVRSVPNPFLDVLDAPDPNLSVPVRNTTLTPLQALALSNDTFVLTQAQRFAAELERRYPKPAARIDAAFLRALGRRPDEGERSACAAYVRGNGLPAFCRLLFNTSEFVFVD